QFFVGFRMGLEELQEEQKEWSDHGRQAAKDFARDASSSIATFINPLKDDFLEIDSLFSSMLSSMVGSLTKSVAEMAVQWGIGAISRAGANFGWWDSGAWKIARDQVGMVHKDEMIVPAETARVLRGEGTGPTFSADTAFGGRNPEFAKDFATGAMKTHGLFSLEGLGHYAAGNITLDRLVKGITDPRAIMGNVMTGGLTNAIPNALGLQGKWADFGQTFFGMLSGASFGPAGAIVGAVFGSALMDRIGDALNMRENELLRNFFEGAFGNVMGGNAFKSFNKSMAVLGTGGGGAGGFGGGFSSMGAADVSNTFGGGSEALAKHGGIFSGPESGYPATLHGTERIFSEADNERLIAAINKIGGGVTINAPLVKIEGNLIADQATFDDFIVKINDALFKFAEMGY
ncbi:hypothetical protein LCGC14_2206100, partial [marine sediment metagenome]